MYKVYIIESEKSGMWYYGQTSDLAKRLKYHNSNLSKFTRNKGPWRLIFTRSFETKSESLEFENHLKKVKNKKYIKQKYSENFLQS